MSIYDNVDVPDDEDGGGEGQEDGRPNKRSVSRTCKHLVLSEEPSLVIKISRMMMMMMMMKQLVLRLYLGNKTNYSLSIETNH